MGFLTGTDGGHQSTPDNTTLLGQRCNATIQCQRWSDGEAKLCIQRSHLTVGPTVKFSYIPNDRISPLARRLTSVVYPTIAPHCWANGEVQLYLQLSRISLLGHRRNLASSTHPVQPRSDFDLQKYTTWKIFEEKVTVNKDCSC